MKKKRYILLPILLLFFSFVACNQQKPLTNNTENIEQMQYKQNHQSDITTYIREQFSSISDVTAVVYNQELIVAIKATTFQQINEQSIEKKVKKKLKKQFQFKKITVSSDQKIFIEINKIHQSSDNLKEKFNHIKKLLKDNA
ncbi:YhcN/YlaJ family sporulation lipoprotein [Paraliobacillus sp. JSM ZJ581]|uniref:YhcN/YlaJ family sporulation lipoprotein n=1 Tax=Paraliobacillus sp. JSM ZJ581 TaxID=3342118 RepID=UPI0035A961D1